MIIDSASDEYAHPVLNDIWRRMMVVEQIESYKWEGSWKIQVAALTVKDIEDFIFGKRSRINEYRCQRFIQGLQEESQGKGQGQECFQKTKEVLKRHDGDLLPKPSFLNAASQGQTIQNKNESSFLTNANFTPAKATARTKAKAKAISFVSLARLQKPSDFWGERVGAPKP